MYHIYFDTFDTTDERFNYLIVDDSTTPLRFIWQLNLRSPCYSEAWQTVASFEQTDQVFAFDTIEGLLLVYTTHDDCIFTPIGTTTSLADLHIQFPEHFI